MAYFNGARRSFALVSLAAFLLALYLNSSGQHLLAATFWLLALTFGGVAAKAALLKSSLPKE